MSRRWRYPRVARGRILWVPPAAIQPPPRWLDQAGWRPRWPQVRLRRGRFFEPPRTVAAPPTPPDFIPQFVRPRVRLAVVRRARFYTPPWPVSVATPPPWVPTFTSSARPPALPPRRGRFTSCPPSAPQPPAPMARTRQRIGPGRRGAFVEPPWVTPPPDALAWVPDALGRHRTPSYTPRRGRCFSPPWPQAVPPAPPDWVPPTMVGRRPRPPARRGRFIWCPLVGSAPVVLRAIHADVAGPAIRSLSPTGPAFDPNTVGGPATARQLNGPAASRTITGIGV